MPFASLPFHFSSRSFLFHDEGSYKKESIKGISFSEGGTSQHTLCQYVDDNTIYMKGEEWNLRNVI
jgi:hypothetical protein